MHFRPGVPLFGQTEVLRHCVTDRQNSRKYIWIVLKGPRVIMFFFFHHFIGLANTAFFAALDQKKNVIGNPAVIVWRDVKYNPGGHYSSATGTYTAPQDGYYQFTVMKMASNLYSYSYLLVDGVATYTIMDHAHAAWKQHGGTVTLKLKAGSKVQVQSRSSTELWGYDNWGDAHPGIHSWFSGHLLFPVAA